MMQSNPMEQKFHMTSSSVMFNAASTFATPQNSSASLDANDDDDSHSTNGSTSHANRAMNTHCSVTCEDHSEAGDVLTEATACKEVTMMDSDDEEDDDDYDSDSEDDNDDDDKELCNGNQFYLNLLAQVEQLEQQYNDYLQKQQSRQEHGHSRSSSPQTILLLESIPEDDVEMDDVHE